MSSSESAEITDMIRRTFEELGGKATKADVSVHVRSILPKHLRDYLIERGLSSKINGFFLSSGDNHLPLAPNIGDGVHVHQSMLTVEDYQWVIAYQMRSSKASRKRAEQYQQACLDAWGVLISLDDPLAGVA